MRLQMNSVSWTTEPFWRRPDLMTGFIWVASMAGWRWRPSESTIRYRSLALFAVFTGRRSSTCSRGFRSASPLQIIAIDPFERFGGGAAMADLDLGEKRSGRGELRKTKRETRRESVWSGGGKRFCVLCGFQREKRWRARRFAGFLNRLGLSTNVCCVCAFRPGPFPISAGPFWVFSF